MCFGLKTVSPRSDLQALLIKFGNINFPSVQEFMTFTSQLIVERSEPGSRASVKEQGKCAQSKYTELSNSGKFAPYSFAVIPVSLNRT